jgi:hypothetical protein
MWVAAVNGANFCMSYRNEVRTSVVEGPPAQILYGLVTATGTLLYLVAKVVTWV